MRAALELLGQVSVDRLTTRLVAAAVGVSQPALFKHFVNRDAMLEAVMEHVRMALEESVIGVFAKGGGGRELATGLVESLFRFADLNPGAPRLFFFDAATSGDGQLANLRGPLGLIVGRQTALMAELVRGEIAKGELPGEVDAKRAGELLVAMVQGELLRWHLGAGARAMAGRAAGVVEFWWAGLRAGQPELEAADVRAKVLLAELDVRPLLSSGGDPFSAVFEALGNLESNGTLVLTVPFRPVPLLAMVEHRGFRIQQESESAGVFTYLLANGGNAVEVLDLRDLPTPEPLEAVLLATSELKPGKPIIARLPRFPRLLIPGLEERELTWTCVEEANGAAVLYLSK